MLQKLLRRVENTVDVVKKREEKDDEDTKTIVSSCDGAWDCPCSER